MTNSVLIPAHGGALVDLVAAADEPDELRDRALRLPSIQLSERALCDPELLACGAFSPLESDPYEAPENPELVIDTVSCSAQQNARRIIQVLRAAGLKESDQAAAQNAG